ncbi:hypothetical protein QOZ80_3BG0278190 [Eleusine coracana subsp. coracana]|nr:hypothetical protein QOZ80_3BG0278190 [Eleusine coracana subsp. coracana]
MRVAVVGAGLSGLAAAHELARSGCADVTLYEKENYLGGQAKTVAVDDGGTGNIDLGLMVFNRVTYPNMMQWLEELGVEMVKSDMSFSVCTQLGGNGGIEWGCHNGVSGLLAQKSNSLSPSFWRMIHEIFKFKNNVLRYVEDRENNPNLDRKETLGQFVRSYGYSQLFKDAYLIPMCGCIWSCPETGVLEFPAFVVLSYFRNNHLSELLGGPECLTVKDGLQSFVNKQVRRELETRGCKIKTNCEVKSVSSFDKGYRIIEVNGSVETYDKIIFAIRAPDALKVLGAEATHDELRTLGAFQYIYSAAYLHHDESLMPRGLSAWSARNFLGTANRGVCITYWLNLVQNIDTAKPLLMTLNPPRVPNHVLYKCCSSHVVPSMASATASSELYRVQGKRGIWFCGEYQGYGYHEDGFKAGKAAASDLLGKKCDLAVNIKVMVPSWIEAGARVLVGRFLKQYISIGNLSLIEQGGSTFSFGEVCQECCLKTVLQVHNPGFYWKVATEADLGLADAYINGYYSFVDNNEGLLNLLLILISNRDARKRSNIVTRKRSYISRGWWTPLLVSSGFASVKYILSHHSRKNTVTQTRRNISEHYDLSNDFFALFLDPSMSYSSGIFKTEGESLEQAQRRKISLLINKANVEQDHHVLEIGSGWGTLAIQVVKETGCRYTGITLSDQQLVYAQKKVKEAGLEDHITFLLCDYRQIPSSHKYDRIISCEMIEHVGHKFMDDFFSCCEYHLAEHGLFVLQFSSIPEERYDEYRRSSDFIKEYIFPGASIPSLDRIISAMSNASRLCVEHIENIGYHYYSTLMCWRDNFEANRDKVLALGFDDKFIRTWEYYFIYCAAGFKSRTLGDYQIVFSRPGNMKLSNYVTIT